MQLATFNVLHGCSPSDGVVDAERFAVAVRSLDADILGLQEVDRAQPRSGYLDLTALAADALDAVATRFQPAMVGSSGGPWRPAGSGDEVWPGPAYGVALVSRVPVVTWRTIRLPRSPLRRPVRLPGGRVVLRADTEPRAALAAVLASGPVSTVVVTHLTYATGWNVVQLRRLRAACRDLPDPLVLLGDLNMAGKLPARATGWRSLAEALTYPVQAPDRQIDHILVRGGGLRVHDARAVPLSVSDHRALAVEVLE